MLEFPHYIFSELTKAFSKRANIHGVEEYEVGGD
jgi:hypothetical protein